MTENYVNLIYSFAFSWWTYLIIYLIKLVNSVIYSIKVNILNSIIIQFVCKHILFDFGFSPKYLLINYIWNLI